MMNYAFRWIVGWTCFYLGDWISHLPGGWWYDAYNWLMVTSSTLDHDDLGIWYPEEDDNASDQQH